jgi:hypothetical protein
MARGAGERGMDAAMVHLVEVVARAYPAEPRDGHRG